MSLEAARGFLAAGEARRAQRQTEAERQTSAAQEVADDGGLIAYAQRIARRRDPNKCAPMHHLARMAAEYEAGERAMRGEGPPIFVVMHGPVQHGKTSLIQADVLRTLRRNPRARLGYVAFNADRAQGKMWTCRELAHGEGIRIHPSFATKREWRTIEGGVVRAGGILDGSWTGEGFDKLYLDDLYAGPHEADSAAHRLKVERSVDEVILTRLQPWTSVFVDMARWNPSDISGVLIRRGWRYVCLPAIDECGCRACLLTRGDKQPRPVAEHTCRALWPDVVPLAILLAWRDGRPAVGAEPAILAKPRRTWSSLYQGQPVPEGDRIFDPSHLVTYDRLPEGAYIEGIGLDAAYGARQRHDQSALVGWRRYVAEPRALYLTEAWIGHEAIELFACRTAAMQIRRAGGPRVTPIIDAREIDAWRAQLRTPRVRDARRIPVLWYASGTEAGAAGVLRAYGAQVHLMAAGVDKLARAQGGYVDPDIGGYTSAWSEGRIRWPAEETEHTRALRIQHEDFTGAPTDDDDGVDAAVAGHDLIQVRAIAQASTEQRARAAELQRARRQPTLLAPDGGPARMRW